MHGDRRGVTRSTRHPAGVGVCGRAVGVVLDAGTALERLDFGRDAHVLIEEPRQAVEPVVVRAERKGGVFLVEKLPDHVDGVLLGVDADDAGERVVDPVLLVPEGTMHLMRSALVSLVPDSGVSSKR